MEHWETFDVVLSVLLLEAATTDRETCEMAVAHMGKLVKAGGTLIICGMSGSSGYLCGETMFPDAQMTEETIRGALKAAELEVIRWEVRPLDSERERGISELVFDYCYVVAARKTH